MKPYYKTFTLSVICLLLCSCNNDLGITDPITLSKDYVSFNYKENSLNIKVKGNNSWYFEGVVIDDITHEKDTVMFEHLQDSIVGSWYKVCKKKNGESFNISCSQNLDKKRYLKIFIFNMNSPASFILEQSGESDI